MNISLKYKSMLIMLILTTLCITSLYGCNTSGNKEIQLCMDALETLESQTEFHIFTSTLEGTTPESLQLSGRTEYWICENDWMYVTRNSNAANFRILSMEGEQYIAGESGTDLLWEKSGGISSGISPVPDIDFNLFNLESTHSKDGVQVITLASDEKHISNNTTLSNYQYVFTLAEDNSIREIRFCFTMSSTNEAGNTNTIYTETVTEYHPFQEGDIRAELEQQYQDAVADT